MIAAEDIHVLAEKYDPTHTTDLRNAFKKDLFNRFDQLSIVIYKTIVQQDCFGLLNGKLQSLQFSVPMNRAFAFTRDSQKIEAFMMWLRDQVNKGILSVKEYEQIGSSIHSAWTNMYIYDSYKRGVLRARSELKKAGYDVPPVPVGMDVVFGTPFHMDRVGVLFTRTFSELKGITEAMDAQISQILAQGMIDGDGPRLIAKKILTVIQRGKKGGGITDSTGRKISAKKRAETLARTEIIRAHHLATIQEYRNWGLLDIKVIAEWNATNDDRVCPECLKMDGKRFTLDEIEPMIPLHPNCRCIAIPYIEELEKFYTKR